MKKSKVIFITLILSFLLYTNLSFGQVVDNFEYYFLNQQLACQSQNSWTTWSLLPCDPVEDPYLSSNFSYSGTKSVKIVQDNDLVNTLDSIGLDYYYLHFWIYIPSGKVGYFNLLSGFTPNPPQWAMECFFDEDGTGRLIHGSLDYFTWTANTWHSVGIILELYNDNVEFWFNGVQVSSWQWSQGGLINLQLDAIVFYGATANDEMYVDDFTFWDGCLSCTAPPPPSNLIAQEIFNPWPKVKLDWQDNSIIEYAFHIVRKNGYPNDPGSFEFIGTTSANVTEYIDPLVVVNQRYSYGVVAHGGYGYSDTSNFATIIILPSAVPITIQQSLEFSLSQNYPNPFNPSTKIKFTIPIVETRHASSLQMVSLKVFDILGNEIATIVNEELPAGEYEVEFNASSLTSGIYFYQLKAGLFIQTKKMILMK